MLRNSVGKAGKLVSLSPRFRLNSMEVIIPPKQNTVLPLMQAACMLAKKNGVAINSTEVNTQCRKKSSLEFTL